MFEEAKGGTGRTCYVQTGRWLGVSTITCICILYYYNQNYLINDSSSYILICMSCLLWNSTRSSHQDARGRTGNGGRGVSLETISPSIRSGPGFPHYMCQWARRLSRVELAVFLSRSICDYTRYLKWLHARHQISKYLVPWYIYWVWVGWVGLGLVMYLWIRGDELLYSVIYYYIIELQQKFDIFMFLGDIDPKAWDTVVSI